MQFTAANILALATAASAATIKVAVGQNKLTYTPNDIKASVGDIVEFSYFPKNHTVTQSSFSDPCHPIAGGGFFSGFVPTTDSPSSTTFSITVKDTKPIWFYCSQTALTHCQAGMVGAINAPSTGNTLQAFTNLAANATLSTFPSGGVQGGTLNTNGASSNSSSSSSGSSSNSGKSSSTYTTSYTTSYSTTATLSTSVTSVYTSAGQAYTTTYASSYTTAYATTVATAAVTTAAAPGSGSVQASAASALGVSGVMSSMFVLGAALIGALVMA